MSTQQGVWSKRAVLPILAAFKVQPTLTCTCIWSHTLHEISDETVHEGSRFEVTVVEQGNKTSISVSKS